MSGHSTNQACRPRMSKHQSRMHSAPNGRARGVKKYKSVELVRPVGRHRNLNQELVCESALEEGESRHALRWESIMNGEVVRKRGEECSWHGGHCGGRTLQVHKAVDQGVWLPPRSKLLVVLPTSRNSGYEAPSSWSSLVAEFHSELVVVLPTSRNSGYEA